MGDNHSCFHAASCYILQANADSKDKLDIELIPKIIKKRFRGARLAQNGFQNHGKVIEKTIPVQSDSDFRRVLGIVPFGGPGGIRTPYLLTASEEAEKCLAGSCTSLRE